MAIAPAILGTAYFTGVKLVGYSAAGYFYNRREALSRPRPLVFGATRTLIGLAVGLVYGRAMGSVDAAHHEILFATGLLPIRFVEWLLILTLFYRHTAAYAAHRYRDVALGIAWSYVLDLPAVFAAFALPGGFWVC